KMQLYGLKILHSFLKKESLKSNAILELTTYTKTVTCLIDMLGWTSEQDKDIRSFATNVMVELADNLRVVSIPGAMQFIASLLDIVHGQNIKDPLLDIGSPRCWRWITKHWSVPEEEPSTDQDLLPVQGMLILDKLASLDIENCIEISRSTGLISKIVEFTSKRTDLTNINETHQTLLKCSSLKLLTRLASTKGKFGVTMCQMITKHPFLLSNLAEILDNNGSSQELRELTAQLIRNLAMGGNVKEIGHIPMIISRLMDAFLSRSAPSSTDTDQLLRMIAGQELALLAMESANNCLLMLAEPGYVFIK
uniref:Uncharacterized protein n=1 Tax=Aegilops tauschii subsp. strangulata TaxID=200361 RepID=A0A453AVX7_AEGTS